MRGLCYMCGEATPLTPYASTERVPEELIPAKKKEEESGFKEYLLRDTLVQID